MSETRPSWLGVSLRYWKGPLKMFNYLFDLEVTGDVVVVQKACHGERCTIRQTPFLVYRRYVDVYGNEEIHLKWSEYQTRLRIVNVCVVVTKSLHHDPGPHSRSGPLNNLYV